MSNFLDSFVPKYLVTVNKKNEEIITVSTKNLSADGDTFIVDTRVLVPSVIETTQSLQELQPEVSDVYPYKIVTPVDYDGATILISPSISTQPTASQGYYVATYFERYNLDIVKNIDKNFVELSVELVQETGDAVPPGSG